MQKQEMRSMQQVTTSTETLYLAGKFGEDQWEIVTCREFNSFVWQTHLLTHIVFYNLSNVANALDR